MLLNSIRVQTYSYKLTLTTKYLNIESSQVNQNSPRSLTEQSTRLQTTGLWESDTAQVKQEGREQP